MIVYINDEDSYLCELPDGSIGWSKHIIDAKDFTTTDEATDYANRHGVFLFSFTYYCNPPSNLLHENPYLPPKVNRIRLHTESHDDYLRRLGLCIP